MKIEQIAKVYDANHNTYIELVNRLEDVKSAIKKQNYGIAMDILYRSYPEFQIITPIEPKESEDEKIRKELIKFVKVNIPNEERYIAWLEKQVKPMEINPTEFDTRLQSLIGKFDSLPKEELIRSLSFWLNVVQNDGIYKE